MRPQSRVSLRKSEGLRQAARFETYKNRYASIGLCHYCAAQAAYGHQHGFSAVEQPRHRECWEIVEGLPNAEVNAWRSMNVWSTTEVAQLAADGVARNLGPRTPTRAPQDSQTCHDHTTGQAGTRTRVIP